MPQSLLFSEIPRESIVAAISAISGAFLLKVLDRSIRREDRKDNAAAQIRTELRLDNASLRDKILSLEARLDEWREKYYALLQEHTLLTVKFSEFSDGKKHDIERAIARLEAEKEGLRTLYRTKE